MAKVGKYYINKLQACALWKGSMLETKYTYGGGLTLEDLIDKCTSLSQCDDLTQGEKELYKILEESIAAIELERGIEV